MYMGNNKGPKMELCGTPYLMVWISDLSLLIVAEIAFELIKSYSFDVVMV